MAADNKLCKLSISCAMCPNQTRKAVILGLLIATLVNLLPQQTDASAPHVHDIENNLRAHGFTGSVYPINTYFYEKYRKVKNGACNVLYPLIIIRPTSTRDVAIGVKVAISMYLPVSVRSGGHGYLCNNIKNGSLHFDLRRMNKVQMLRQRYGQVSIMF